MDVADENLSHPMQCLSERCLSELVHICKQDVFVCSIHLITHQFHQRLDRFFGMAVCVVITPCSEAVTAEPDN